MDYVMAFDGVERLHGAAQSTQSVKVAKPYRE
jgi:hypothetical protein